MFFQGEGGVDQFSESFCHPKKLPPASELSARLAHFFFILSPGNLSGSDLLSFFFGSIVPAAA